MAKIFPYILFLILILSEFIETVPLTADGNEGMMVASTRLRREADRLYHYFNSMPNAMKSSSNDFASYFTRNNYAIPPEDEEEDDDADQETVYVNMKIDSNEEPETKYVNLFIDSK